VDGSYNLHGYKWFSSATDSDMALTLARVVDAQVRSQFNLDRIDKGFSKTVLMINSIFGDNTFRSNLVSVAYLS
jgi:hypothetical protein